MVELPPVKVEELIMRMFPFSVQDIHGKTAINMYCQKTRKITVIESIISVAEE